MKNLIMKIKLKLIIKWLRKHFSIEDIFPKEDKPIKLFVPRVDLNKQIDLLRETNAIAFLGEQNYIHISIDEFEDICDGAASVKEVKELLFERQKMQEDKQ